MKPDMIRNCITAVVVLFSSSAASASSDILYDFTETIYSGGLAGTAEMGQSIQLPYQSTITQFSFSAGSGPPYAFTDDILVRFYKTTGLHGTPTDLLWTGLLEDVILTRSISTFTIDVPNVEVPRTFAFSIELVAKQYALIFHPGANSMPLGRPGWWFSWFEDSWYLYPDRDPAPFAVRLVGVPGGIVLEPSSIAFGGIALACATCFAGRKSRNLR